MERPPPALTRELARVLPRLLHPDERSLLLAVSGGPDSLALLDACARPHVLPGLRVEVAWVDHGLREASVAEGEWVRERAGERGVPFHAERLALAEGPGIEARARVLREAALERVRETRGLSVIATGHTASDQAETLLMRLSRGAALRGVTGILQRRGRIIRPLLGVTRQQILAHLHAEGLSALVDPMNDDPALLRCRVRHRVLPALEAATDPGLARRLARFAGLAAEDDALLQQLTEMALRRLLLPDGRWDAVGLRALQLPLRRRALARIIEEAVGPVGGERLEAALEALDRPGRCDLRDGASLVCSDASVRILHEGT